MAFSQNTSSQKRKVWEGKITDPTEQRVCEALSDNRWEFRTVEGIARATHLPEPEVAAILKKYPKIVRKSHLRNREGRELYALRSPKMINEVAYKLKGLVNGVNPKWGTKTVVVSDSTGDIIEVRGKKETE